MFHPKSMAADTAVGHFETLRDPTASIGARLKAAIALQHDIACRGSIRNPRRIIIRNPFSLERMVVDFPKGKNARRGCDGDITAAAAFFVNAPRLF